MGKSKVAQAGKPAKIAEVKTLSSVKGGGVTKPSQTPKSKSKELAKQVAAKSDEGHKKSKKSKKEPTPEPSSESESGSDEEMSSASSADSDEESDDDIVPVAKTNGAVSNGVAKNAGGDTSDSSESSDDADEPAVAGAPKGAIPAASSDDDSADDSEDDSGDESDDESDEEVPSSTIGAEVLKGKLGKVATKDASSADSASGSDDSSDAESADGSSSGSEESSEEEEEKIEAVPNKKRKAEAESAPVAKKVKAEAPVANGDGGETGNLFVGNLSWNVDEEWLAREFEPFGELKSTRIITDRETGRSKGFGYVEFVDAADGARAHAEKKGAELDGRNINVDFATAKKEKPAGAFQERSNKYGDQTNEPSATIFCANLAFGATQDDVSDAFGEHAPVSAVRIPTDRDSGQPKGFAYVEFGSIEDAVTAFEGMKGANISGRSIRVDYASSKPRNDDGGRGGGRGGFGGGRGRGGFDRGGRGGGRGRGGFDRGGGRGGRGGSTNRGGFGDFKGKKMTF
ncbi:MAG: hypothetical protein Q9168_006540 [Polycauliona sp. 1 TL-2023]